MDNLPLIFKNAGYVLDSEEQFATCPLCKSSKTAYLLASKFYCNNCTSGGEIIQEVFRQLKIVVDTSPINIQGLTAKYAEEIVSSDLQGINTGYSRLDKRTGGLLPGHLYVLASETGMGKSAFSMNLLINICKSQHVSYFDLENGRLLMLKRFIAIASLTPIASLTNPDNISGLIASTETTNLGEKIIFRDNEKLEQYIGNLQGIPMAETIASLIRTDVETYKTKVVVIDPLENFDTEDKAFTTTGKVVELFKNLAQKLRIAIIINHHLKKPDNGGGKRVSNLSEITASTYRIPTIYDLTGTSKITNKATDVWTIVRQKDDQDINKRGKILLRILKAREDRTTETGDLYFNMNLDNGKIAEVEFLQSYEG